MINITNQNNTLTHRLILCLDITAGRVVKGVNFVNLNVSKSFTVPVSFNDLSVAINTRELKRTAIY